MKISVIGGGAIGSLVAGYLKAKGEDVDLIGRPETVSVIRKAGLKISGVRGELEVRLGCHEMLISKPDIAILTTKTQDIDSVFKDNAAFLKKAVIVTTQNGIQADDMVAKHIPKGNIVSSIVMFGATYLEPGRVTHNFEGPWVLGKLFSKRPGAKVARTGMTLDKVFSTVVSEDIKGMKYLKLFVNANNCIPAILGVSMQEAFLDHEMSRISIAIWREGFEAASRAGIKLASLPGFPLENITRFLEMPPQEAAKIFSGIMANLSKDPLYGSVLQSIMRGRPSEIDYINGEFVNLADKHGSSAPLNKKLVEMVHQVERANKFFKKEELLKNTKGLVG